MKQKCKRTIVTLLVTIMILSAAPLLELSKIDFQAEGLTNAVQSISAWLQGLSFTASAEDFTSGIYTYTLSEDDATITNVDASAAGEIVIPSMFGRHPVVMIGENAFSGRTAITGVTIPSSVTVIGPRSFSNCTNLRSVSFSSSLTKIENNAFENTALTRVDIPDTVTEIGAAAFLRCQSLSEVHLSKNLQKLGGYAFGDCDQLISIEIPKSLKETTDAYEPRYIYGYVPGVFIASDNLKTVTFETGITKIADCLFGNISTIESINLPDTVTEIGSRAFENCNLKSISFSSSLTKIGANAFAYTALTRANIPDTVTEIGAGAFLGCQSLSEVHLPKNLQKLCGYAFGDCDQLTSIEIPKSLKETTDEYYHEYLYGYHYGVFIASDNLTTVTFETGITKIVNGLFANNYSIENIALPNTITEIGSDAFSNCKRLKSISFSSSLTKIGANAFAKTGLTRVDIPDTVTEIGAGAFLGCQSLSEVRLSKNLQKLCGYAFGDCDQLTSIEIPKSLKETTDEYYHEYLYGYHYGVFIASDNLKTVTFEQGITKIVDGLFANNSSIESMVLPNTITEIGYESFRRCSGLKSIVFSDAITKISANAFADCSSLESISIPYSVKEIGHSAFYNCSSLKSAEFKNDDTILADNMFCACSSLETVVLPRNMTSIPDSFFKGCVSLNEFDMPQSITRIYSSAFYNCDAITQIAIPAEVVQIDKEAFYDCDSLKTITMGDAVANLGNKLFQGCDVLENVILSKSLKTIPNSCFADCPALKEIEIPHEIYGGVTEIKNEAFKNCTALTKVIIPVTVTTIGAEAFSYNARTTIYGCRGTYAETYANDGGFNFVDITNHITGIALKDNDEEKIVITRGTYCVPEFEYLPIDTTDVLTLSSNDTNIVRIQNTNRIYGYANGTTSVTVTTTGGLSYDFTVYVHSLNSLTITSQPAKLTYNYGEAIDLTGLVVSGTYSDGLTESIEAYEVTGYNPEQYGEQTVTVTYAGKSTSFIVTVLDSRVAVASISITNLPKTVYQKGEAFDGTGMVVTATFTDGTSAPITGYSISAMNSLKVGIQTLTVTYLDPVSEQTFSTTFNVTVGTGGPTLSGIAVKTMPSKTTYNIGEIFNQSGLTLTATYSDGSTQTISSGFICNPMELTTVGTQIITVTYSGKTATFTVTVKEATQPEDHTHDYTATITTPATCTEPGEATYTCDCGDAYTETIPALGHVDENNDGKCDACGTQMTGGDHCKFCGKIHNGGFFDKLTGFFHKIFAIFKR